MGKTHAIFLVLRIGEETYTGDNTDFGMEPTGRK
jgi:hypothetical protein